MKKENMAGLVVIVVIAAALLYAVFYFSIARAPATDSLDKTFNVIQIWVTQDNVTSKYYVYIAQDLSQQELGYMNQTSLGDCNEHSPCLGMLFQFKNTSNYCFWMENTEIPLKQAWISQNGTVVYVANATPYNLQSICYAGIAVLETSPNQNITVGDMVLQNQPPTGR